MLPSALDHVDRWSESLVVGLDFDGTLAPIVDLPDDAQLLDGMGEAMAALLTRHAVAVISGRGVDDLRPRVGLEGIVYGGCHGLQLRGEVEQDHEEAARLRPDLDAAAARLRTGLKPIAGSILEHKGLAIAVHRRNVEAALHPSIDQLVTEVAGAHPQLRRKRGHMVDELLPDVPWHKGEALAFAAAQLEARPVLYLGDDRTDEDAFEVLSARQLGDGILVATEARPSAATHQLRDPEEVLAFLRALA